MLYGEVRHMCGTDVEGDGNQDSANTEIISGLFGMNIKDSGYIGDADINRDGTIIIRDLSLAATAKAATI